MEANPPSLQPPEHSKEEAHDFKTTKPTVLAAAIFKGVAISGGKKVVDKSKAGKKVAKVGEKEVNERRHVLEFGLAAQEVRKIFGVHHLEASDPFTAKWEATILECSSLHHHNCPG